MYPHPYRTFTQDQYLPHFSFEHPSECSLVNDSNDTSIGLFLECRRKEINDYTFINIMVFPPIERYSDAESLMNYELGLGKLSKGFNLLEMINVKIGGIPAQGYAYSFIPFDSIQSRVKREVFFDSEGLIWDIEMISAAEIADSEKEIFNHVLATLQILN